jgi:hypothetical protein
MTGRAGLRRGGLLTAERKGEVEAMSTIFLLLTVVCADPAVMPNAIEATHMAELARSFDQMDGLKIQAASAEFRRIGPDKSIPWLLREIADVKHTERFRVQALISVQDMTGHDGRLHLTRDSQDKLIALFKDKSTYVSSCAGRTLVLSREGPARVTELLKAPEKLDVQTRRVLAGALFHRFHRDERLAKAAETLWSRDPDPTTRRLAPVHFASSAEATTRCSWMLSAPSATTTPLSARTRTSRFK